MGLGRLAVAVLAGCLLVGSVVTGIFGKGLSSHRQRFAGAALRQSQNPIM